MEPGKVAELPATRTLKSMRATCGSYRTPCVEVDPIRAVLSPAKVSEDSFLPEVTRQPHWIAARGAVALGRQASTDVSFPTARFLPNSTFPSQQYVYYINQNYGFRDHDVTNVFNGYL